MLGESIGAIKNRAWRGRLHLARMIKALIGMDEEREANTEQNGAPS